MDNFLNFIDEDIDVKKMLISTMPKKNETSIKKYNAKIDSVLSKYDEYEMAVRNYLVAKSNSFNIKKIKTNINELADKLATLQYVKFLLNPNNCYFEKIGFDNLLYRLINYYEFNVDSLNDIINEFLNKFLLIDVKLDVSYFNYTCYVTEYMTEFFISRESGNYDNVAKVFEKIYWVNPEIVKHIELNFRKLIYINRNKFTNYVDKLKKEVMSVNDINSYEDCLKKLKSTYVEYDKVNEENINDIIDLTKCNEIDMTQFFEDSKFRMAAFNYLIKDFNIINDKNRMKKMYSSLHKLKDNISEYNKYIQFLPFFENFKTKYAKEINDDTKNQSNELKNIWKQITNKENRLEKISKDLTDNGKSVFGFTKKINTKELKIESIKLAQEVSKLYIEFDNEYFEVKIKNTLNKYMTLSDLIELYYSYDYFKKVVLKEVFDIKTYDELNKYSDDFDLFAMSPLKVITNGVFLFEKNDIAQVIINKYKIDDIYLDEDILGEGNLENLLNKLSFMLRVKVIEDSPLNVEQLWFMGQVEKIVSREEGK